MAELITEKVEEEESSQESGESEGEEGASSEEEINIEDELEGGDGKDGEKEKEGEDEEGEEEEDDDDLFGKDNEDYMKANAVSQLRPPMLPPSSFPRKQDFRDAGGRRMPSDRGGPAPRSRGRASPGGGSLPAWSQSLYLGGPSGRGGRSGMLCPISASQFEHVSMELLPRGKDSRLREQLVAVLYGAEVVHGFGRRKGHMIMSSEEC